MAGKTGVAGPKTEDVGLSCICLDRQVNAEKCQTRIHVKATPVSCPRPVAEDVALKRCPHGPKKTVFRRECGAETVETGPVACIRDARNRKKTV